MSKSSQDFWGVIKFFGPLAALQFVAFTVPALFFRDNYSLLAAFQFSCVLAITALAAGTGYKAGKRDAAAAAGGGAAGPAESRDGN